MIHRALKRTPRWLQPHNLRALRRPLPWLITLALALLVGGVGTLARIGLFLASPETFRYASEIVSGNAANYGFWALGPLIPPINPDAIEEAAAAEQTPPQPAGPAGPQNPVPIAVVGAPTESPSSPTAEPPSPQPSSQPSPTPTATRPPPSAEPPSPQPSRTVAAALVPTAAPINTIRPTSTPVAPSSTPVTRPDLPPPATTNTPQPTATTVPTTPPGPTRTTPPVQPAPTTPPTPSPTSTPSPTPAPQEPPLLSFAVAARTVSEDDGRVEVELKLSKTFDKVVTARYATEAGTARADEDYRSSSGTVTFEPGTLSRTLAVPIIKDEQDEPNERFTIKLLNAENATLTAPSEVLVTITDTTAPPKVSFAGTGRTVSESDGTAAATIQLSALSAIDVTVPYTVLGSADANDHSLRTGTVIIPAGSTSARLRFAVVDDRIDEGDETVRIDLGTPTDAQSGPPSVYVVTITDDDTAGVSVAPTQFNLAEKGPDATYAVVLESQPVAPVTIAVRSEDGQLTAAPAQLTFTALNWDTPQEVSVRAVDDDVDEPDFHPGRLAHAVTSADPNYDGFDAAAISARIADDDTVGVLIIPRDLDLAEGGAAASYAVRLTSQPTAAVMIDLAPDAQVTTSRATLTFTPATWSTAQVVTVAAVDDAIDEDGDGNTTTHRGIVRHSASSPDPLYNDLDAGVVTAAIADNDTAGVLLSTTNLTLSEALTATNHVDSYTIRLTSQPTAAVTIDLTPDDQVAVTPARLTFTASDWNAPQTATVTAVNDPDIEANPHTGVVAHEATSADPIYDARPAASVTVSIADNDIAGVVLDPTGLALSEAVTATNHIDTYTVRLTSRPTSTVTVTLTPDAQVGVSPTTLTFTHDNWAITQTVTISADDDFVDEASSHAGTVSYAFASADANYNGLAVPQTQVEITDNDTVGVQIQTYNLQLNEATAATNNITYTVRLQSQPMAPVTIDLTFDDQVTVSLARLTFTAANWRTLQTITVTAVDDPDVEASPHTSTITHTTTSTDPLYNALPVDPVTTNIADNDIAGVVLDPARLALSEVVTATNHIDTYTVHLTSRPTSQVTVTLTPDAQVGVSPTTLVFTPLNWATTQTITATAVDDFVAEASPHTGTVRYTFASTDANYNGLAVPPTQINITDNDTAGVAVTPPPASVVEGGAATYTVILQSEPTAPVTITPAGAPAGRVTFNPPSLTFTAADWRTPQTVTATAVDNFVDAADVNVTVSHTAASADLYYRAIPVGAFDVSVADNDTAALLLTPTTVAVNELITAPGRSVIHVVRLGSEPTAPVTISLSFDAAQITVSPASVTFDSTNWNIPQTIAVSAVDDTLIEGLMTLQITHTLTSADPLYAAFTGATVTVSIADDDFAGVTFVPATLSLSESAAGANPTAGILGIALRSQPTAPVTLTLAPDAQIQITPAVLVFTPTSWNVPQNVSLAAVNDLIDEPATYPGSLALTLRSPDPYYDQRVVPQYAVTLEDNDTAGVVVSAATGALTSESGGSVTFNVRLASQPLAPVSLVVQTSSPEAAVSSPAMPILFTEATWDTPVTVTIAGRDDPDFDGLMPFTVTFSAAGDAAYEALTAAELPSITLANADNEPAIVAIGDPASAMGEGNSGFRALRFPVTLARASTVPVTVSYETVAMSATGGDDYIEVASTLTFEPGDQSQMISIYLVGDEQYEADELFAVRLTGVTADGDPVALGNAEAVGRIRNDDRPAVHFAAANSLAGEDAGTVTLIVTLDAPITSTVTVSYTTIDGGEQAGTATAGTDYIGASGELTFAPGETAKSITLTILDDSTPDEPAETVRLNLFDAAGAPIGTPDVATVTIVEDEGAPEPAPTDTGKGGPAVFS
jgi:hypothetical protein